MGAYARFTPGITPTHFEALNRPCWGSLWFTGEYAHIEKGGYTHGALHHGRGVGGRVVRVLEEGGREAWKPEVVGGQGEV